MHRNTKSLDNLSPLPSIPAQIAVLAQDLSENPRYYHSYHCITDVPITMQLSTLDANSSIVTVYSITCQQRSSFTIALARKCKILQFVIVLVPNCGTVLVRRSKAKTLTHPPREKLVTVQISSATRDLMLISTE